MSTNVSASRYVLFLHVSWPYPMLIDTYIESELSVPFYERRMGYKRRAVRFRKAFE